MDSRRRTEGSYPELFPEDFGERLERLTELLGLSWEEFADRPSASRPRDGMAYGDDPDWRRGVAHHAFGVVRSPAAWK